MSAAQVEAMVRELQEHAAVANAAAKGGLGGRIQQ